MTNTPTSIDLRRCELRTIKTKSRTADTPGHADFTIRVPLTEDLEAASTFLMYLQSSGHPIALTISQLQARFGQPA